MHFIRTDFSKPDGKGINPPVNMDVVKSFTKSHVSDYKNKTLINYPSIFFDGSSVVWVFQTEKTRNKVYNDIILACTELI